MSGWTNFRDTLTKRVLPGVATGGLSEVARAAVGAGGSRANPQQEANKYLSQIEAREKEYLDPYRQQGQAAYDQLRPQYDSMTSDPVAFLENMMKGYEPSRAYQMQRDEALKAAGNTAAAGGMRGTTGDVQDSERIASMLQGQDMQQWLQNVLGLKQAGMQGQQGFYQAGLGANSQMAGDIGNILGSQGQLAFQNASQQNANRNNIFSSLLGLGGSLGGAALGGMVGGPVGAGVGGSMGGGIANTMVPQASTYQPFQNFQNYTPASRYSLR